MSPGRTLEVVATSLVDVRAAVSGGAGRLELAGCHTGAGALTPSAGLMVAARGAAPNLPVLAMIRPRYGAFTYDADEIRQMEHDIRTARASGLDGVFFGAVTRAGELDAALLQRLFDVASGLEVCINMAFDRCREPQAALDWLVRDGRAARVLTAGGAKSALEGASRIAALIERARGRLSVMAGSGIDAASLPKLLEAVPALEQVHVSAGARDGPQDFAPVDAQAVARLRRILEGESQA